MDEKKIRTQFPLLRHNPTLAYLDNAATTQKPDAVLQAMQEFYEESNANAHRGLYGLATKATEAYEIARKTAAEFINAEPEEIIFVPGATAALNGIAHSLHASGFVAPKPKVVTTDLEHNSSVLPWQQLAPEMMQFLPLDEQFALQWEHMYSKADVFATTMVSNVTGTVVPVADIIKKFSYPYTVVDATQAITHLPIDVKKSNVDFLTFSAHKLYGPTGIGVLYGKKEILEELQLWAYGGGMVQSVTREEIELSNTPHKFEAGSPNIAGAVGLAAAIEFVQNVGLDAIAEHEETLRNTALRALKKIDGITMYHPPEENAAPVISFSHEKVHAHDIAQFLGDQSIAVRAGHHCTHILHSEVVQSPATVRISFGMYNTMEEVERCIEELQRAIEVFGK